MAKITRLKDGRKTKQFCSTKMKKKKKKRRLERIHWMFHQQFDRKSSIPHSDSFRSVHVFSLFFFFCCCCWFFFENLFAVFVNIVAWLNHNCLQSINVFNDAKSTWLLSISGIEIGVVFNDCQIRWQAFFRHGKKNPTVIKTFYCCFISVGLRIL